MKLQDIAFLFVLLILLFLKKPKAFVIAGLLCLLLSIPFFAKWIFFTAQHLVWYAAGFFLVAILFFLFQNKR